MLAQDVRRLYTDRAAAGLAAHRRVKRKPRSRPGRGHLRPAHLAVFTEARVATHLEAKLLGVERERRVLAGEGDMATPILERVVGVRVRSLMAYGPGEPTRLIGSSFPRRSGAQRRGHKPGCKHAPRRATGRRTPAHHPDGRSVTRTPQQRGPEYRRHGGAGPPMSGEATARRRVIAVPSTIEISSQPLMTDTGVAVMPSATLWMIAPVDTRSAGRSRPRRPAGSAATRAGRPVRGMCPLSVP